MAYRTFVLVFLKTLLKVGAVSKASCLSALALAVAFHGGFGLAKSAPGESCVGRVPSSHLSGSVVRRSVIREGVSSLVRSAKLKLHGIDRYLFN